MYCVIFNMYCVIYLIVSNFSGRYNEMADINLVSVSGLFASFKSSIENNCQRRTTHIFHMEHPLPWQTMDLFLGLFSGFGRNLIWEVDDSVEFINICPYSMVKERFIDDLLRFSFPPNCCNSFMENQFCEVLFTFKSSVYLGLS